MNENLLKTLYWRCAEFLRGSDELEDERLLIELENAVDRIQNFDEISITWTVDDFDYPAPWLTLEQRRSCLVSIEDNHDANYGINWDTLEDAAYCEPVICKGCGKQISERVIEPVNYTCSECGFTYSQKSEAEELW